MSDPPRMRAGPCRWPMHGAVRSSRVGDHVNVRRRTPPVEVEHGVVVQCRAGSTRASERTAVQLGTGGLGEIEVPHDTRPQLVEPPAQPEGWLVLLTHDEPSGCERRDQVMDARLAETGLARDGADPDRPTGLADRLQDVDGVIDRLHATRPTRGAGAAAVRSTHATTSSILFGETASCQPPLSTGGIREPSANGRHAPADGVSQIRVATAKRRMPLAIADGRAGV